MVICISAGQNQPKKADSIIARRHRYLNYGLMKLASILDRNGYPAIVIHGLFNTPEETVCACITYGIKESSFPILLSIPSFYALEWSREFIAIIKIMCPGKQVIVGGRWVIGNNPVWLKTYLNADMIVPGRVENEIIDIIRNSASCTRRIGYSSQVASNESINYKCLHEAELFQPSIEVSSGCGMGCTFCEERDQALTKLKPASAVATEMNNVEVIDGLITISPYLESSMFVANNAWAINLHQERTSLGVTCNWRVESRVDKLKPNNMELLAKAGLKVIDLGLESASHEQLLRMNKSTKPADYLAAALDLINAAHESNIWLKLNILLYPGETAKSISETANWLAQIKNKIKGVSVGPVIIYGADGATSEFAKDISKYGATAFASGIVGVTNVHISNEISHEKAISISSELSREFMCANDYFDLKSFSYFSRDYSRTDFLKDIDQSSNSSLSFSV